MPGESGILDLIAGWLPPDGEVLDAGCGSDRMLTALAEDEISGFGVDPYASDIRHCAPP
jgi:hypothetical protein